jgi:hypothetical protein
MNIVDKKDLNGHDKTSFISELEKTYEITALQQQPFEATKKTSVWNVPRGQFYILDLKRIAEF